jgi:YidC/Oxa1 family membrane protein insertase
MGQQFYVIRNNPAPGTPAFKAKQERDARHGKTVTEDPLKDLEERHEKQPPRQQPKNQSRNDRKKKGAEEAPQSRAESNGNEPESKPKPPPRQQPRNQSRNKRKKKKGKR